MRGGRTGKAKAGHRNPATPHDHGDDSDNQEGEGYDN